MNKLLRILLAGILVLVFANSAAAREGGDWIFRAGLSNVDPKSDNGDIVEVDADLMFTFDLTYMMTEHWAVELLAAAPFTHEISLINGPKVAEAKQLPPTLSLQYHFNPRGRFQPYVGAGVNVTIFFDEETRGVLDGADLDLDNSVGFAAQVGFDWAIREHWIFNGSARYMAIDTDAKLNGTKLENVEIDPIVIGFNLGYVF